MSTLPYTGEDVDQTNYAAMNTALVNATDYVVSGCELTDGTGLNVDVGSGIAVITGLVITYAGSTESLTASQTNYVFLVNDDSVTVNITGTAPANSLCLGIVTTDGSGVTALYHRADTDDAADAQITQGDNVLRIKGSDETVNNSSTLQDDDDLQFTAAAREVYYITYNLLTAQASATPNFQCRVQIPSGFVSSGALAPDDDGVAGTKATGNAGTATYNHTSSVNGTTHQIDHAIHTSGICKVEAAVVIGATGGTVKLQWAQISATSADTDVLAGSIMLAERIRG